MTLAKTEIIENHYLGHRMRLRQRFLRSPKGALPDYELLEMMLFAATPRKDVKPLAKQLLLRFGNLAGVMTASIDDLRSIKGMNDVAVVQIKTIEEVGLRLLKHDVVAKPILQSWKALLDYCRASMGHAKQEQFRLLFLDSKNMVIGDELQDTGTIDQIALYPREVVRRALQLQASSIIMVHNHPSGDTRPSVPDIQMTKQIIEACKAVGILLHDHVIISRSSHYSFRAQGVI